MSDYGTPALPLHAVRIQVATWMIGFKCAVQFGDGPVLLSPAMYALVEHATPDELQRLLEALPLMRCPALPTLRDLAAIPLFSAPAHLIGEPGAYNRAAAMIDMAAFLGRTSGND